jgi:Asp-tRNA(Asn)/Glu-tRNA(Gln) amidotransferase A subunit family amidase
MPDPLSLSVRDAAQEIAAGRLTAEALTTACLNRIAAREAVVGAWHYLDRDAALAPARGPPRGAASATPSRRAARCTGSRSRSRI